MTLDAALRRAPAWQRLGAALACSLALHAWLLAALRTPAPPRDQLGAALRVSLGEGEPAARAPLAPVAAPRSAVAVPPPQAAARAARAARPAAAEAAAEQERASRGKPSATVAPAAPPRNAPAPALADADAFLGERELAVFPALPPEIVIGYPPKAVAEGRRGRVMVQLMVDADGRVLEAQALPGASEDFAAAALEALRGARLQPARGKGGERVRARVYVEVSFVIE